MGREVDFVNAELLCALTGCETDVDGALHRFSGKESLYMRCLNAFLADTTIDQLGEAIGDKAWDDAFTAAHALKGLAGNMGFIPLFHATSELVILIRSGRIREIDASYMRVRRSYDDIASVIQRSIRTGTLN